MNSARYIQNCKDNITYYERYFAIILAFAGIKMTPLSVSILAHAALFERLDKEVKSQIAIRNNTNEQVVANGISKLRKSKHITGSKVTAGKLPAVGGPFSLTLTLNVTKETKSSEPEETGA